MKNHRLEIKKLVVNEPDEIQFRENFHGGISNAMRLMQIGEFYWWDKDDFNRQAFHALAKHLGIKIATKTHKKISCVVVYRIA